jgi:hypothetical protein
MVSNIVDLENLMDDCLLDQQFIAIFDGKTYYQVFEPLRRKKMTYGLSKYTRN